MREDDGIRFRHMLDAARLPSFPAHSGVAPTDDNDYVNKKTQLILKRMSTR